MSWTRLQDISSRDLWDMSWSRLPDVLENINMFTGTESISVSNKSKSVSDKFLTNKPISDKSKANPRQIQDTLIRTPQFWYSLYFESAKSRAWRACVLACFSCLRACVLTCLARLRAYVLTWLACLRAYVLNVLTCLACLRACVLGVLLHSRA